MPALSKEEILGLADRRETRTVPIEGVGEFILKEMSGTDRDALEQSMVRIDGKGNGTPNLANARAKLLSKCLVGEDGELLFTSANDVANLGKLPSRVLSKLYDEAAELNGLSEEDIEALAGNSEAAESGSSTSD